MRTTATLTEIRAALEDWQGFVLARSHVLRRYPSLLFQEAANEPSASPQAEAAERTLAAGRESRPFIRWLNKPQSAPRCLMTLAGHQGGIEACALSPDGSILVSGSGDGTIKFWNTRTGREQATTPGRILGASPDGTMIVSQSPDHAITLWNISERRAVKTVRGFAGDVSASSFSSDGRRVLFGTHKGAIALWDTSADRGLIPFPDQERSISVCAFSPDGSRIFSRTSEGPGKLWDAELGSLMAVFPNELIDDVWAFSRDGSLLVAPSGSKALVLCDARTGRVLWTLPHGEDSMITACAISPDGSRVVAADVYCALRIWDVATGQEIATLFPDRNTRQYQEWSFSVSACAFSPDGSRIVSQSSNGYLVLWDPSGGREAVTLTPPTEGMGFRSFFVFSPDGSTVLAPVLMRTGVLNIWAVATGRDLGFLGGHWNEITCCAFSADRSRLATGSNDETVRVWNAANLAEPSRLAGHSDAVSGCEFSHDGARVLSGSRDGTLKLWDPGSGRELAVMDLRPSVLDTLPDRIEYHRDEWGRIRSSRSRPDLAQLLAGVERCWFSSDGKRVVSKSADKSRRVWDAVTGLEIKAADGAVEEADSAPPEREAREASPWHHRLTLERQVRPRSLIKSDSPTSASREVWIKDLGWEIARFADILGEVKVCAVSPVDTGFVVGDDLGSVYILKLENVPGS